MRLDRTACLERFGGARVARLATAGVDGAPHQVPVTFALVNGADGDPEAVVMAVDAKPKTSTRLRRLRNVAENPNVALLVDHYADDWDRLWWVRADARAEVLEAGARWQTAIAALASKYDQYQADPPVDAVLWATVERWSGWAFSDT